MMSTLLWQPRLVLFELLLSVVQRVDVQGGAEAVEIFKVHLPSAGLEPRALVAIFVTASHSTLPISQDWCWA